MDTLLPRSAGQLMGWASSPVFARVRQRCTERIDRDARRRQQRLQRKVRAALPTVAEFPLEFARHSLCPEARKRVLAGRFAEQAQAIQCTSRILTTAENTVFHFLRRREIDVLFA